LDTRLETNLILIENEIVYVVNEILQNMLHKFLLVEISKHWRERRFQIKFSLRKKGLKLLQKHFEDLKIILKKLSSHS